MAAHRRPRQHPLNGTVGRTATTLALTGAVTATAFGGSSQAEPRRTPAQVKAEVDRLYREAEEATEKYNGAKEKATGARTALDALRDEAARRTERLNTVRNTLGSTAAAQYRSGGLDPALKLVLSADPDGYLRGAALAERAGAIQAGTIAGLRAQLVELHRLRTEADGRLRELSTHQAELERHRSTVRDKLAAAEKLLGRLTADQRARYDAGPSSGAAPRTRVPAPNPRAAQAVAYAYGALGRPYVWGATGPSAFDCSGLTQAAWRSAGVSLPRTTYTQIGAGRRVPRSQLAPGDLVFFYSGISHVGLYIGGGRMIHAPRPGAPVRIAPIDEMPWAGATRVV